MPNIEVSEKRIIGLDYLKGIGIILVFIGHTGGTPDIVKNAIYTFHMPLFFCVSGFLRKDNYNTLNILEKFKQKAKALLWPYVILGIIAIIYNTIDEYIETGSFSFKLLCRKVVVWLLGTNLFNDNSAYIGVLWFVICLFVVCILFEIIKNFENLPVVLPLACCAIGIIYSYHRVVWIPFEIDVALVAVMFYAEGHIINHSISSIKAYMRWLIPIMLVIGMACGIANLLFLKTHPFASRGNVLERPDMMYMSFGESFLFLIGAGFISAVLILVSIKIGNKRIRYLEFLGRNSLLMMFFSIYIQVKVYKYTYDIGFILNNWISQVIISIVLTSGLTYIVRKCFPIIYRMPGKNR